MPKDSYKKSLAYQIYRLQVHVVRELNDIHIFVQQALPLLEAAKMRYELSKHKDDRDYFVPSVRKDRSKTDGLVKLYSKAAKRTDCELKEIYDRFISRELVGNLLVASVSKFESFLFDVLRLVLSRFPKKLSLSLGGAEVPKNIPLEILLDSQDLTAVIDKVIRTRIHAISYAAPSEYIEYFGKVTGVAVDDPVFLRYIEVKATRDLLVHADGIANDVYISKAKKLSRARPRELIPLNTKYFEEALATMKRVSGIIKRDTEKDFSDVPAS